MATQKKGAPAGGAGVARKVMSRTPPADFRTGGDATVPRPPALHAAALDLAARGWAVFPCKGKVPATAHGFKDATKDPQRVADWWPEGGTANIGAVPPADVFVVDIDTYKAPAELEPLADRLRALSGPAQRSGGGGWHVVLRGKPPSARTVRRAWGVKDGIDVKSHARGYVLASPSAHPETGVLYEWATPLDAPIPEVPDWLVSGPVKRGDDAPKAVQPAEDLSWAYRANASAATVREALARLSADCPHDVWIDRGQALKLEFGEEGFDLWNEWSATAHDMYPGQAECRERWDSFGQNVGAHDNPVTVRSILHDAGMRVSAEAANPTAGRFSLEFGGEMEELVEVRSALGMILPVGVVLLAGLGGTGKSTVAATWTAHVTNGKACPPWERPTVEREPAAVLWISTEESQPSVRRRNRRIGGRPELLAVPKIVAEGEGQDRRAVDFDIERDLVPLLRQGQASGRPIRLVVCDTLVALVNWDRRSSNSEPDVKRLLQWLNGVAENFGCCVLAIAHFNKKADQASEYRVSGSQAWRDLPRLSFICEAGHIFTNKTNDLPDLGTSYKQEVVEVVKSFDAVTRDDRPVEHTLRRAVFGPFLLSKSEVLGDIALANADATESKAGAHDDGIGRMAAEAVEVVELLGGSMRNGALWSHVQQAVGRKTLNGLEKQRVIKQARLTEQRDQQGRRVLVLMPHAHQSQP